MFNQYETTSGFTDIRHWIVNLKKSNFIELLIATNKRFSYEKLILTMTE